MFKCQRLQAAFVCCNKTTLLLSSSWAEKPDYLFASMDEDQGGDVDLFHVQSTLNCEGILSLIYFQLPTPK